METLFPPFKAVQRFYLHQARLLRLLLHDFQETPSEYYRKAGRGDGRASGTMADCRLEDKLRRRKEVDNSSSRTESKLRRSGVAQRKQRKTADIETDNAGRTLLETLEELPESAGILLLPRKAQAGGEYQTDAREWARARARFLLPDEAVMARRRVRASSDKRLLIQGA